MTHAPSTPLVEPGIEWVRPRPGARSYRRDALLAVVLAVGTAASLLLYRVTGLGDETPEWQGALWVAGMTLPLAARRRWPEAVAFIASIAFAWGLVASAAELLFSQICLFIAIYTVGAWSRSRRVANVVRGIIVAGMFAWVFWQAIFYSAVQDYLPELERTGDSLVSPYVAYSLINVLTNLLYFGGAWYFGDAAYRAARSRAALEQRTAELAAERERSRAQAVALERVRIARELHDVVAHHVSVMGVQAGAARRVLERDPAAAATALAAIESSARDAVDELHRLLGTLRAEPGGGDGGADAGSDAASTRGLAQLPELVEEQRAAGLPVSFEVVGEARPVPATIGLAAYRIAQEALTNVRKHAGAAAMADVRLRYLADAIELEVVNTGAVRRRADAEHRADEGAGVAGVSGAGTPGTGLGQIGMRERVAAAGGTIELGPRSRGGYLVRARLPLAEVLA